MPYDIGGTFGTMNPYRPKPKPNPTVKIQPPKPTYTPPKPTAPAPRAADTKRIEGTATSITDTEPAWLKNAPSMGGTSDLSSDSYYDRYLRDQQRAIQERTDAAVEANNRYIPQVNQRSDKSLQNAYILREQNKVNAPQAMSALGYTGGASETALMGINTNYENSRNQIEDNRRQSLDDIYQNELQIRATGDATKADAAADYYNRLISAQEQAQRDAQAQENWQATYDLQEQQYADAAAQQAWQNLYDEKMLNYTTGKPYYKPSSGDTDTKDDQPPTYSAYFLTADRILSTLTDPSSIRALIQSYNTGGRLSDDEATMLMRKYGV